MLKRHYKTLLLIVIGVLMGVAATVFIQPNTALSDASNSPMTERKILFWYDPMYPATKFDKPGPSPFMDMDLVPKYADEGGNDALGVTINPTQTQNLGLRTDVATMGQLHYRQDLPANVNFNQYQYHTLQARASGFVEKTYPLAVGDYVQAGDALVDVTVTDWVAAQSEYLTLLSHNASATLLNGVRDRLYLAGMSNELIEQLKRTKQIQSYITIRAPQNGVLTSFDIRNGMTLNKSATIATIEGIDPVWVVASLPESLSALLNEHSVLTVSSRALPGQSFVVKDWQILADAQSATRTLSLRLTVDNPNHTLKPGMTATVQLATTSDDYVLVPSQAIIDTGLEQRVITQDRDGHFIPKTVSIYAESQGQTALLSGLAVGEKVVTSGLFLIDSEANINGALERMRQTQATQTLQHTDHQHEAQ